jgi:hypothetical protein
MLAADTMEFDALGPLVTAGAAVETDWRQALGATGAKSSASPPQATASRTPESQATRAKVHTWLSRL